MDNFKKAESNNSNRANRDKILQEQQKRRKAGKEYLKKKYPSEPKYILHDKYKTKNVYAENPYEILRDMGQDIYKGKPFGYYTHPENRPQILKSNQKQVADSRNVLKMVADSLPKTNKSLVNKNKTTTFRSMSELLNPLRQTNKSPVNKNKTTNFRSISELLNPLRQDIKKKTDVDFKKMEYDVTKGLSDHEINKKLNTTNVTTNNNDFSNQYSADNYIPQTYNDSPQYITDVSVPNYYSSSPSYDMSDYSQDYSQNVSYVSQSPVISNMRDNNQVISSIANQSDLVQKVLEKTGTVDLSKIIQVLEKIESNTSNIDKNTKEIVTKGINISVKSDNENKKTQQEQKEIKVDQSKSFINMVSKPENKSNPNKNDDYALLNEIAKGTF